MSNRAGMSPYLTSSSHYSIKQYIVCRTILRAGAACNRIKDLMLASAHSGHKKHLNFLLSGKLVNEIFLRHTTGATL